MLAEQALAEKFRADLTLADNTQGVNLIYSNTAALTLGGGSP
jgi:hypothetical protein